MEYATYHELLREELERRKQFNSAYSLRAFARDIGLAVARLSQVLNEKEGLSFESAQSIAKKLKLEPARAQWFCESVGALHSRSQRERNEFRARIEQYRAGAKAHTELQLEYFKVIADWYHFAVLELTYLKDFRSDVAWIAGMLGVSRDEAKDAITRLKKLGLLREEKGKLVDTFEFLATPSDTPSASLKKFNAQLMKKAADALYERPIEEREIASNIFAVKKDKVPALKKKIRELRRAVEAAATSDANPDSVYCFSTQLFELTERNEV